MRTAPYSSALLFAVLLVSCTTGGGAGGGMGGSLGTATGGTAGVGLGGTASGGTATGASGTTAQAGGGGGTAVGGTSAGGTGGTPAGGGGTGGGGLGGAAGAGGGAAGAAGTGGGGAGGSTGAVGAVPSMGCGTPATDAVETFVNHDIVAAGDNRSYFVRLPLGYDQNRAYPLMIIGPGCGGSGDMSIPAQDAAGPDAIVVGLNINPNSTHGGCFVTESATSPELDYFDVMWAEVQAAYCVDKSRVFYGGFSSGAWLANLYGCAKSDVLRAQGSVAGGFPPIPECPAPIAAIMIHDDADNTNGIGGVMAARDRILTKNGCVGTETMPWDPMFPDCQLYTGCPTEYPVVWCMTNNGSGHSPQDELSAPAFWKFLMSLPPKP